MAGVQVLFDPTAEATGTQIDVTDSALGYWLLEHAYPVPEDAVQRAGSADTEGDIPASSRPQNRTITLKVRCAEPTGGTPAIRTIVQDLQEKVGKFKREGGTYRLVLPDTTSITFDVLKNGNHNIDVPVGLRWLRRRVAEVSITLECKFAGRAAEVELGTDTTEATLPALIKTATGVTGPTSDVTALGRFLIDEDQGVDQWWLVWGIETNRQYAFTDSTGSGALFYEAESRTVLGGASVVTGTSPASGGGSNNVVRQATLTGTYQAMLSTQASGGGAHLSHVGNFRVFARVFTPTTNAGGVSVALEWGEADFRRRTLNDAIEFEADHQREGQYVFADFGQVRISKVAQGTQRWEGRFVAKSTVAGDDLDIDYFILVPIDEASGEVAATVQFETATTFQARDEFDQTAGALTGKVLPVGGTWAGAGDADDFTIDTVDHTATRTAVIDASSTDPSTGRLGIAGSTSYAAIAVQSDIRWDVGGVRAGVFARYVDINNFLVAYIRTSAPEWELFVYKRVASTNTQLVRVVSLGAGLEDTYYTIRLLVDVGGRVWCWLFPTGQTPGGAKVALTDPVLATGGALASGKVGIFDWSTSGVSDPRDFDNFAAFTPSADAAVFASQSVEIRHDRVHREDSAGAIWSKVSTAPGDYLLVPPAGTEGRKVRAIVKACRNDPYTMTDPAIDDISGRLFVTPRHLVVPS